ncbi:HAAS signaling domain-containing protein [Paenibacillus sp. KN14-4R]|uniref:HAAS signaling domain-containing protein n=1 Tax=Paenibacillus sp. KN14-4R TaxID=3445773 RepID=UPI003FA03D15
MNKSQFMTILQYHLYAMPIHERKELLAEYDMHFQHGQQNGLSEPEIAYELGDPVELAREALGAQYINPDTIKPAEARVSRTIFTIIGQFFLNISVTPLLGSLWLVCLSLVLACVSLMTAPVLASLDFVINQYFSAGKLFISIACLGVGIIAIHYALKLTRLWTQILLQYFKWIGKTIKGERSL